MKKENKKHINRLRKLIICCGLCAIILTVSTYAWFVGMKTVNVSDFDVKIAAIDGLSLSLDARKWSDTVQISQLTYSDPEATTDYPVYPGNTNSWGGSGLIPMSSVGVIDNSSSRLKLFEKGSLTTTPGGFRLMASRVQNSGNNEANGYVAFDLFVKNLSGNEYYGPYDELNEEAIYLTPDSAVKVALTGSDGNAITNESEKKALQMAGIENSVRVGFSQIGRVVATTTETYDSTKKETGGQITSIKCQDNTATGVTVICDQRVSQIWEPNDKAHVQNAINWYDKSCKSRSGDNVTTDGAYSASAGTCGTVANGTAYPTYAVSGVIDNTSSIDVYDGAEFNTYAGESTIKKATTQKDVKTLAGDGKLVSFPYFTDTMKVKKGTERPTFMTLAPNSITKIRVYIWIEGQDVDNYDFAQLGKKISVAFGISKERYYDADVDYQPGSPTLPTDVQKSEHADYPVAQATGSTEASGEDEGV